CGNGTTCTNARPYVGGNYIGSVDRVYTFTVSIPGVVGQGNTAMAWSDSFGITGTLNLGSSGNPPYHAPLPLAVGNQGLQIGFDTGSIAPPASFTVAAHSPLDTFTY